MSPRVFMLATPMHDQNVTGAYMHSIVHLLAAVGHEVLVPPPGDFYDEDVVRVRSRYARVALEDTDCTDVLWIDSDMSFRVETIQRMIASGHDVVTAPYPRKRVDWGAVMRDGRPGEHPEIRAYSYAVNVLPGPFETDPKRGTAKISSNGFGCTITSRACLQRMTDHYRHRPFEPAVERAIEALRDLPGEATEIARSILRSAPSHEFDDVIGGGKTHKTVALFGLAKVGANLLPEDRSFFARWRAIGGDVHMILDTVDHVGPHYYRGHIEAFSQPEKRT